MTDVQQRAAAKEFTTYWKNRGDAKQKTQTDADAGGGIWQNRLTPKR